MRRIGHRGAKGHAPDNTIDSFAKALELGCDEVETDVWLTDDGRLLVSHDRPKPDLKLTLEDVLDFCRGKMGVNVELKCEMSEKGAHQTGAQVGKVLAERRDPDGDLDVPGDRRSGDDRVPDLRQVNAPWRRIRSNEFPTLSLSGEDAVLSCLRDENRVAMQAGDMTGVDTAFQRLQIVAIFEASR